MFIKSKILKTITRKQQKFHGMILLLLCNFVNYNSD